MAAMRAGSGATDGRELGEGDDGVDPEVLKQPLRRDQPSDFAERADDLENDADGHAEAVSSQLVRCVGTQS